MKKLKLIACSFLFLSISSYAQFDMGSYDIGEAFKTEIAAHDVSPVIQGFISEVEAEYAVACDGFTSPVYPYLQKQLTYKATCKGEVNKVKLTLRSSYASTKTGIVFTIKKYSIKLKVI
jgi:hypothetical protein